MSLDNVVFNANRVYSHSSDFPEEVVKKIPSELLNSIDRGKEGFFEGFKDSVPNFHKALMENASQIYLIEMISFGMGLNNLGKESKNYYWGFQCNGKLITAELKLVRPEQMQLITKQQYLPCIPSEFHCFYQKTDGMAIASGMGPGGFDLPASFGDWRRVQEYCRDYRIEHNISMVAIDSLYKEFRDEDLRIFIKGSFGDIVFINFSAKDGKLYHVKNCDFLDYRLIEHAPQALDSYFANAVIGFPEPVNLR
jgi:hypothetical protein